MKNTIRGIRRNETRLESEGNEDATTRKLTFEAQSLPAYAPNSDTTKMASVAVILVWDLLLQVAKIYTGVLESFTTAAGAEVSIFNRSVG